MEQKLSAKLTTQEARAALNAALQDLCGDFNSGAFTPILEADVVAYLYHRLLVNGCTPDTVYLQTRICGKSSRRRKPDLVVGTLHIQNACVQPVLICELKAFQRWGLSDQQMRRRFEGILAEDLPCLEEMFNALPAGRIEILADFFISRHRLGYLTGSWGSDVRIDMIADECKRIGASLIWIRPKTPEHVGVEVLV